MADILYNHLTITADDLIGSGYTGVTQQGPEGTEYPAPNTYFWVNGASADNTTTGNLFNLVMISQYTDGSPYNYKLFNYGSDIHPIQMDGAQAQEGQLKDGRTVLNFAKGNYYIVVMGLDNQKVEALANKIAGKI